MLQRLLLDSCSQNTQKKMLWFFFFLRDLSFVPPTPVRNIKFILMQGRTLLDYIRDAPDFQSNQEVSHSIRASQVPSVTRVLSSCEKKVVLCVIQKVRDDTLYLGQAMKTRQLEHILSSLSEHFSEWNVIAKDSLEYQVVKRCLSDLAQSAHWAHLGYHTSTRAAFCCISRRTVRELNESI